MTRSLLLALVALMAPAALGACASTPQASGETTPEPSAESDVMAAPANPIAGTDMPRAMREYEDRVADVLAAPLPPSVATEELDWLEWVETDLSNFLGERAVALRRGTDLLALLEASPAGHRARLHLLVAWVYEDTAMGVLESPIPRDAEEPERHDQLSEIIGERVSPLLPRAADHFDRCARLATAAGPAFDAMGRHCTARRDRVLERVDGPEVDPDA